MKTRYYPIYTSIFLVESIDSLTQELLFIYKT